MRFLNDPVGLPGLIALAVGLVVGLVAVIAARSRARSFPSSKDAARDRGSVLWIALQGVGFGIAGFGPIDIALDSLSPKAVIEAGATFVLMLAAVWLFDSASRAMGRNWALVARTRSDGALVESGPFAAIRNPIYVALFCVLIAMAIAYGHTVSLIVALPVFAIGTWMRVRREEIVLRATFGDAYNRYAARVKRFVPGLF